MKAKEFSIDKLADLVLNEDLAVKSGQFSKDNINLTFDNSVQCKIVFGGSKIKALSFSKEA